MGSVVVHYSLKGSAVGIASDSCKEVEDRMTVIIKELLSMHEYPFEYTSTGTRQNCQRKTSVQGRAVYSQRENERWKELVSSRDQKSYEPNARKEVVLRMIETI